jgi:hypothetical protein
LFEATLDAIYGVEVDDSNTNIDTSDKNNNNETAPPPNIDDTSSPRSASDVNMTTNSSNTNNNNNHGGDDDDNDEYNSNNGSDDQEPIQDPEISNDDNESSTTSPKHILPSTSNLNDFTGLTDRTANDELSSIAYYTGGSGGFDPSTSIQTAQSISIQQQSQLYVDSIEDDA